MRPVPANVPGGGSFAFGKTARYFLLGLSLPIFLSLLHLNIKVLLFHTNAARHSHSEGEFQDGVRGARSSLNARAELEALLQLQALLAGEQQQALSEARLGVESVKEAIQGIERLRVVPGLQLYESDPTLENLAAPAPPAPTPAVQQHQAERRRRLLQVESGAERGSDVMRALRPTDMGVDQSTVRPRRNASSWAQARQSLAEPWAEGSGQLVRRPGGEIEDDPWGPWSGGAVLTGQLQQVGGRQLLGSGGKGKSRESPLVRLQRKKRRAQEEHKQALRWLFGQQSAALQPRVLTLQQGVEKLARRRLQSNITHCADLLTSLERLNRAICAGETIPWCRDANWLRFSPARCTEQVQPLGPEARWLRAEAPAEPAEVPPTGGSEQHAGEGAGPFLLRAHWQRRHGEMLGTACSRLAGFLSRCHDEWPVPGSSRASYPDCSLPQMCRMLASHPERRQQEQQDVRGVSLGKSRSTSGEGLGREEHPTCSAAAGEVCEGQGSPPGAAGPVAVHYVGRGGARGRGERESVLRGPSVLWRVQRVGKWGDDGTAGESSARGAAEDSAVDGVSVLLQYFKHPAEIPLILGRYFRCSHGVLSRGEIPGLRTELLAFIDETSGWKQWREAWNASRHALFFRGAFTHNLHESRGYNRLAAASRGSLIILIQDDDVPPLHCDWLARGLRLFRSRPLLAVAGFRHGLWKWRNTGWSPVPNGMEWRPRGPTEFIPHVDPGSGVRAYFPSVLDVGPLAVRRSVWQSLGGLDEGLSRWGETHAGYADYDLAYRTWIYGREVMHVGGDKESVMGRASTPGETHKFSASLVFRDINLHLNRKWVQRLVTWIGPRLEKELRRKANALRLRDVWVQQ